jgi:hypothetical protein
MAFNPVFAIVEADELILFSFSILLSSFMVLVGPDTNLKTSIEDKSSHFGRKSMQNRQILFSAQAHFYFT